MNKYITDMLVEETSYKSIKTHIKETIYLLFYTIVIYGILKNAPPTDFMTE